MRRETTDFRPDGKTNAWLSLGWKTAKNDQELELQRQALKIAKTTDIEMKQREMIFRQLALLNYLTQSEEARKVPTEFRSYTVQLDVQGGPLGGAFDQVLPSNPRRKRLTLLVSNVDAFISHEQVSTLQPLGVLQVVNYIQIQQGISWPIESSGPLWAVSADTLNNATLGIVEELYKRPITLSSQHLIADMEERRKLQKHTGFGNENGLEVEDLVS